MSNENGDDDFYIPRNSTRHYGASVCTTGLEAKAFSKTVQALEEALQEDSSITFSGQSLDDHAATQELARALCMEGHEPGKLPDNWQERFDAQRKKSYASWMSRPRG